MRRGAAGPDAGSGPAAPGRPGADLVLSPVAPVGEPQSGEIDVNGAYFGSVANGASFYRDVPPGHYHIVPVSYNRDFNQDRDIDLAAGQQAYIKILSLQNWDGACRYCLRDTFYAWLIPSEAAQNEIARDHTGL